ncbi:MAG TPA: energy transducer TonB [Bacteroidota bacterium]|nr:energy transducer TonB [Bacteroidota bacterium]
MAQSISSLVPYQTKGYGAAELKALYQKYYSIGLLISILICCSLVGTYHLVVWLSTEEEPVRTVRVVKISELGPPPSLQQQEVAPAVASSGPIAKPSVGVPVPVPDAEVSPEQTIATQAELSQQVGPIADINEIGSGNVQIQQDIVIDENEPPADFVPVEKEPVIVKEVKPKYPEIALRAGLEGNVYVKVWVDKEGKVKKVVVLKSDAEIFNEAAIEAAQQFVFTPAIMQNKPVPVWVSIPFRFRLKNAK